MVFHVFAARARSRIGGRPTVANADLLPNPANRLDSIAKLLGVSVGTLYNHITDLKELVPPQSRSAERCVGMNYAMLDGDSGYPDGDQYPVVYLAGNTANQLVKIGSTRNLLRIRMGKLRSQSPVPIWLLWWHPGGRRLESALHHRLAPARRHGEWFDLGADPVGSFNKAVAQIADYLDEYEDTIKNSRAVEFVRIPDGLSIAGAVAKELSALEPNEVAELIEVLSQALPDVYRKCRNYGQAGYTPGTDDELIAAETLRMAAGHFAAQGRMPIFLLEAASLLDAF